VGGVADVVRQGRVVPARGALDQAPGRPRVVAPPGPQVAEGRHAERVDVDVGGVQADEAQPRRRRGEDAVLEAEHHAPVVFRLVLAGQGAHAPSVPRPPDTPSAPPVPRRRGAKRASVAVGHSILVIASHRLTTGEVYTDLGPNYLEGMKLCGGPAPAPLDGGC
jgi:hypothetical protein